MSIAQRTTALLIPLIACGSACDRSSATGSSSSARGTTLTAPAASAAGASGSAAKPPEPVGELLDDATELAVGRRMSCALRKDGVVYCWEAGKPARRTIMTKAAKVAVVDGFVCAIQTGGHIACARPYEGELIDVPLYRDGVTIVGGPDGYCVDTEDGVLRCGVEDEQAGTVKPPSGLPGLKHPKAFSVGQSYGFGLVDEDVWAWDNRKGPGLPKTMAAVEKAAGVAVGRERACLFTEPGELWCYDLTAAEDPLGAKPSKIDGWSDVRALSISYGPKVRDLLCALRTDGTVACSRLVGEGPEASFPAPRPLPRARDVAEIGTGAAAHGCVRTGAGAVSCWERESMRLVPVRLAPKSGEPDAGAR